MNLIVKLQGNVLKTSFDVSIQLGALMHKNVVIKTSIVQTGTYI